LPPSRDTLVHPVFDTIVKLQRDGNVRALRRTTVIEQTRSQSAAVSPVLLPDRSSGDFSD